MDRVWVVVGSAEPVRVYLFNGGVLPFGSLKDEGAAVGKDDDTCSIDSHQHGSEQHDSGDDLIVNLWRNRGEAVIWSVDDFRQHLGEVSGSSAAFDRLWAAIQQKIGVVSQFSATLVQSPVHCAHCCLIVTGLKPNPRWTQLLRERVTCRADICSSTARTERGSQATSLTTGRCF